MKLLLAVLLLSVLHFATFAQITPQEAAVAMQKGINLGNTLEPPDEGGWGNPPVQEYYFDLYKEAGFQCVRIPIRWDEHTQTSPPYHVDDAWMNRIEQVVDWGLSRGLFIVINAHHEEWIKANYDNAGYRARFDSIWSQIAVRFSDKSDKLLFEIINEPYGLTKEQNDDLHQRELSIIRNTNPTRIVIFQGHNWGGSDELITAAIPDDNYVMGSFHSYDPYLFGLEGQGTWGTAGDYTVLRNKFIAVKNWSDAHNIPVFLGEFGSVKSCDYNSRMRHYRAYVEYSQIYGFVDCAWDDGGDFRIMERQSHNWNEIKDILIHTNPQSPTGVDLKLYQDTLLNLTWSDPLTDYDSIFIQRRTGATTVYTKIAALPGDATSFVDSAVSENTYYYYRVIAHYNAEDDLYSQPIRALVPVYVPKVREPYLGEPASVPGTVEAENYDIGGEGFTYHDLDALNIPGKYRPDEGVDIFFINWESYQIGYAYDGEWCEYTINVEQDGEYTVNTMVASQEDGGKFRLKIGGVESDTLTVANSGGWNVTNAVSTTLNLTAGEQIMRFTVISQPQFHIDKFEFKIQQQEDTTTIFVPVHEVPRMSLYQSQDQELVIRLDNCPDIKKIEVYNITGTMVYTSKMPENEMHISVTGLPAGLYVVRAVTGNGIFKGKTIISNME